MIQRSKQLLAATSGLAFLMALAPPTALASADAKEYRTAPGVREYRGVVEMSSRWTDTSNGDPMYVTMGATLDRAAMNQGCEPLRIDCLALEDVWLATSGGYAMEQGVESASLKATIEGFEIKYGPTTTFPFVGASFPPVTEECEFNLQFSEPDGAGSDVAFYSDSPDCELQTFSITRLVLDASVTYRNGTEQFTTSESVTLTNRDCRFCGTNYPPS